MFFVSSNKLYLGNRIYYYLFNYRGKFLGIQLQEVGKIIHFFGRINVAVVDVSGTISVGDKIAIKGPTTDIEQSITSMEIEHAKVLHATAGQSVGMKLSGQARENDTVYKIS